MKALQFLVFVPLFGTRIQFDVKERQIENMNAANFIPSLLWCYRTETINNNSFTKHSDYYSWDQLLKLFFLHFNTCI